MKNCITFVSTNQIKMTTITPKTIIRAKGIDISIGSQSHQIALISQHTDDFISFDSIRKGGRLSKIKRMFRTHLSSSTHFFFEGISQEGTEKLISILKK